MARFRSVGCRRVRRVEVVKQVHVVHEETYDDAVVNDADPIVQFVSKLHKGLKLFREVVGDSDSVSTKCLFCLRFARCVP